MPNTLQFLPIAIGTTTLGSVGISNNRPVAVSLNRLLRLWWRIKIWRLTFNIKFATTADPVLSWHFNRTFEFYNHKVYLNSNSELPFEPSSADDMFQERYTSFKQFFAVGTPDGASANPSGWFSVRIFNPTSSNSVKRIGALYYPYFTVNLHLDPSAGPLDFNFVSGTPLNIRTNFSLDGVGIAGFSSETALAMTMQWAGGEVKLLPIDFWY